MKLAVGVWSHGVVDGKWGKRMKKKIMWEWPGSGGTSLITWQRLYHGYRFSSHVACAIKKLFRAYQFNVRPIVCSASAKIIQFRTVHFFPFRGNNSSCGTMWIIRKKNCDWNWLRNYLLILFCLNVWNFRISHQLQFHQNRTESYFNTQL